MLLEHLGDIVACEPVARELRKRDPACFLVWGVRRQYRELVDAHPDVDLVLPLHCLTERLLLARGGLFDEVVDLHFDDRWCSLCSRPPRRASGSPIGLDNYFQYGGILAAFAKSAGLPALEDAPRVYIPETVVQRVDRLGLPARFVAINGSSNFAEKDWRPERWSELAAEIARDFGLPVIEIGLTPVLATAPTLPELGLCGRLSILESAEVIRRAALFVGVDSGPAHLANAVVTPGVVLMGTFLGFPRYQPFSGPYANGEGAEIVRSVGTVADIPVAAVLAAVNRRAL